MITIKITYSDPNYPKEIQRIEMSSESTKKLKEDVIEKTKELINKGIFSINIRKKEKIQKKEEQQVPKKIKNKEFRYLSY